MTFLFTDIEGSTKSLHNLGAEAYAAALAEHRRIVRHAVLAHAGVEVDTQGDAFFVAFPTAQGALLAADEAQRELGAGPLRVRMGLHTGTPHVAEEGYVGVDVHRAARIAACGHGGQILISSDTAAVVGTAGLLDLGLHRLKDLSAPEHIYQLGQLGFPPLQSLHQTNLPVAITPFLGRDKELKQLSELMSRDEVRLLTFTGPGGTGKTRLAVQAAAAVAERYPHGVWWIPLAPLRDPALVLETAASILGAKNALAEHIAERRMLLLFDNFEQVVDAASDIATLLASCPKLHILVTSREPLRVRGEQEYPVPPLVHQEAIALFTERARAVDPDFREDPAIPEICRRLDELPLALELAAARVKVLSPGQILARLESRLSFLTAGPRDLPDRQRTLRATIEWSYDLLGPAEQRLFERIAVFRGGFTLAAAEFVAGANVETLASLVDKSLLRRRDDRFSMLEMIGEYSRERLVASGESAEVRHRHISHYLAIAEEVERHGWKGNSRPWFDRLEQEHDNLRAALDTLEDEGDTQQVLLLAGALWHFWHYRGHLAEGGNRLERALAADERPTSARARALVGIAAIEALRGNSSKARAQAEAALTVSRGLGDVWGVTMAQSYIAAAAAADGDWETARRLSEETIPAYRSLGEEDNALLATWQLAWFCNELGDKQRSEALLEANLVQARERGNTHVEGRSLSALGMLAIDEGRVHAGLAMLHEAHRLNCDLDARPQIVLGLCRFARALVVLGRAAAAAKLLAKAELLRQEIGLTTRSWGVLEAGCGKTLTATRAQLDEARFAVAWEEGRALSLDDAVALAHD